MKKLLLLTIAALFLFSCTTIPVPVDEDDSLAVLFTEFNKESDREVFGSYVFTITHDRSDYKKYIKIQRNNTYFLSGLKWGNYNVSYKFVYNNGKMGTNNDFFSFYVKDGMATIIDRKIIVSIYNNDDGGVTMNRRSEKITDIKAVKEKLLEKHPELKNWEW